jgi:hypothetical protein
MLREIRICRKMPIKRPRNETEVRLFAENLAARWSRADGVEPWLRSLEHELSEKVRHQRWSWESIARTLNMAGITYETNRPWTGRFLLRKIATIRFESRLAQQNSASLPAALQPNGPPSIAAQPPMAPALSAVPFPATGIQSATGDEEPEFKPVTLIRHGERKPPETLPLPKNEPGPDPVIDVDAILAKFTGRR